MNVNEIVAIKTRHLTDLDDTIKQIAIEEVEQHILNYCGIESIPTGLTFTHANMAVDMINYYYHLQTSQEVDTDDIDMSQVSSIKIGDTSVNLGGGSNVNQKVKALNSHNGTLDSITMNYKAELNKYRRMCW